MLLCGFIAFGANFFFSAQQRNIKKDLKARTFAFFPLKKNPRVWVAFKN